MLLQAGAVFLCLVSGNLWAGKDSPVTTDVSDIARMGKLIFSDARFSASGQTSCSSCHKPSRLFSDSKPYSVRDDGSQTPVSTPPLFDMKRKLGYLSDPVFSLELAVQRCMEVNLGTPVVQAYVTLKKDATLSSYSTQHFGRASAGAVYKALAAYLNSISLVPSRYDRFMNGQTGALTMAEQTGMVLFESKGCRFCHTGNSLGGMVFVDASRVGERVSVPVPRLRNLAMTAPYFSDGSAETLRDAILTMSRQYTSSEVSAQELEKIRLFLLSHESSVNDFEGSVQYENE